MEKNAIIAFVLSLLILILWPIITNRPPENESVPSKAKRGKDVRREKRGTGLESDNKEASKMSPPKGEEAISPRIPSERSIPTEREIVIENDVWVLADEIYSKIIYEGEHMSIAALPAMKERTIILDGYTKTYAMTGWRLGYGIMPEELAAAVTQLQINSTSCTCTFNQMAGIEGLKGDQSEARKMVTEFKRRRDVVVDGLNRIPGFTCLRPKGAFYVFPNIQGTGMASQELSDLLLNEAGVAVLPGTAFGSFGEGYLRLSYANSVENIRKALDRIEQTVTKAKK